MEVFVINAESGHTEIVGETGALLAIRLAERGQDLVLRHSNVQQFLERTQHAGAGIVARAAVALRFPLVGIKAARSGRHISSGAGR